MPIVTISRNVYSKGLAIARRLARDLHYHCISHEIFRDAARRYGLPEMRLRRAVHDPPPSRERIDPGRARRVACVRATLLDRVRTDNVVYCGLAGHFFLRGVPHVLKVRLFAGLESRIREAMRRERLSADEAWRVLAEDDGARKRWSLSLHGVESWDASLYDLMLSLEALRVPDAVSLIARALAAPAFRTTPASRRMLDGLALAARVEAELLGRFPLAGVRARDGAVDVTLPSRPSAAVRDAVARAAASIDGVNAVTVRVVAAVGRRG